MSYDIHIAIDDNGNEVSKIAVSLDSRQHASLMRYVYQSTTPLMFRFIDYLCDADITHAELNSLENEIIQIGLDMRKNSSDQIIILELRSIINEAKSLGKGLRALSD